MSTKTTKGASATKGAVTAEQIAERVGATGKDFRRWLRAHLRALPGGADTLAGKGGRYTFTEAQATRLVALYGARKARQGNGLAGALIMAQSAPKAPRKVRRKAAPVTVSHVDPSTLAALEAPSVSQS